MTRRLGARLAEPIHQLGRARTRGRREAPDLRQLALGLVRRSSRLFRPVLAPGDVEDQPHHATAGRVVRLHLRTYDIDSVAVSLLLKGAPLTAIDRDRPGGASSCVVLLVSLAATTIENLGQESHPVPSLSRSRCWS